MPEVRTDVDELQTALKLMPANGPFVMVNLLRYRAQADYANGSGMAPCTGREAYYRHYAEPVFHIIRRLGGEVFWFGHVQVPVYAPKDEHWDDVLLVRYPAFSAVIALLNDPGYQACVVHRVASLEDTRVLATLPGTEIV